MAEARDDDDDDIFVYMGGNQQVPRHIRRARIHKSVKIIRARAFRDRQYLIYVEFHDGVEIIEEEAFWGCLSLRVIKLLGVRIIKEKAFFHCGNLTDVEFGDVEIIEKQVFLYCPLKNIRIPSVRTIGKSAFYGCSKLSEVEFGEGLKTLKGQAVSNCYKLERIALPLKDDMIEEHVFNECPKLTTVDLVGGIHQTVASLHMESWRSEMTGEINRINQVLPTTIISYLKTDEIRQWMESVIHHLDHYKDEHRKLLKEATTLLELALWKASLAYSKEDDGRGVRTEGEVESSRDDIRYTSGADIVIKNVLPFLALK